MRDQLARANDHQHLAWPGLATAIVTMCGLIARHRNGAYSEHWPAVASGRSDRSIRACDSSVRDCSSSTSVWCLLGVIAMQATRTNWMVSLVMMVGCAQVDETVSEQAANGDSCPPWMCANSPESLINNLHELHLFKEENAQGMYLEHSDKTGRALIFSGGDPYELYVEGNRFTGVDDNGNVKLVGSYLVGARLHVMKGGQRVFDIIINSVRETRFPVGDQDKLEVYELHWNRPGYPGGKQACNGGFVSQEGYDDLLGMNDYETLIFVGDRVDTDKITIEKEPSELWINFGCAGRTLAKLHLTRNTTSSNKGSDPLGNQATLKMFSGDYCGTGDPITVSGTPIRWQGGLVKYGATPGSLEARWSHEGATCVKDLRLIPNPAPLFFPNPWASVLQYCNPPSCQNDDPWDMADSMRVSALP
jgi:hypothetical protein